MDGATFQRLSAVEGLPVNDAVYWVYSSVSEECYAAIYHHDWLSHWCTLEIGLPIEGVTHYVRMPERL